MMDWITAAWLFIGAAIGWICQWFNVRYERGRADNWRKRALDAEAEAERLRGRLQEILAAARQTPTGADY